MISDVCKYAELLEEALLKIYNKHTHIHRSVCEFFDGSNSAELLEEALLKIYNKHTHIHRSVYMNS